MGNQVKSRVDAVLSSAASRRFRSCVPCEDAPRSNHRDPELHRCAYLYPGIGQETVEQAVEAAIEFVLKKLATPGKKKWAYYGSEVSVEVSEDAGHQSRVIVWGRWV